MSNITPLFEKPMDALDVIEKLKEVAKPETKLIILYEGEEGTQGWGVANMNNMEMNWMLDMAKEMLLKGE